tara:strand:- start:2691 stop:3842 length:1152 start_codon:yes stop_codon:yes gene_type:complete
MIKKKLICYWSPFIDNVATVKAVINSALSVNNYSNQKFESLIIDVYGEWKNHFRNDSNNLKIYSLNYIKQLFNFSSKGYFKSRLKYIIIFFCSFLSLKKFVNEIKPEFLIIHLITSLPLFLNLIFKLDTKIVLRISGKPKINIIRYYFWKIALKKVHKITFPTKESLDYFKRLEIAENYKLKLLYDPVFSIKDVNKKKKEPINNSFQKKDYFLAIGRLTKQKNFLFLAECFAELIKDYPDIKLFIIGIGEDELKIRDIIKKNHLEQNILLLGYQKNVFKFLSKAKGFILSSLWEDPGFVLIEAMVSNTLVLSSDCPNGPKEILENKNGILFKNNSKNDFLSKFKFLISLDDSEKDKIILNAKKKIKLFSIFNHYGQLEKVLEE